MKNLSKYIFLTVLMSAALSCSRIVEAELQPEEELVTLNFQAVMEGGVTKTVIDDNVGEAHRSLKWLPEDEIAIYSGDYSYNKFVNTNTEVSSVANFKGEATERWTYYAIYPYSLATSQWWDEGRTAELIVPTKQVYAENTFATDMNPMFARVERGGVLEFKNLCGLLVVNLTGEEKIKTLSLAAYAEDGSLAQIAGNFRAEYYDDIPTMTPSGMYGNMIEMDCGDGVQLNPSQPVPFHFVLAPGTYSKITVFATTVDGKVMIKEGRTPLTINRAKLITAGTLAYAENISVNLSERGRSNCYIVPKSGVYSFDAHLIGNGEFGLIEGANFHTSNTAISPVKAEVLWEDRTGVIASVSLRDNKISFLATGQEGNALIVAKDEADEIIWSWHIWATEQPKNHVYMNNRGMYTVLDRNLGATSAEYGDDATWYKSVGLTYQWGRKDPFISNCRENISSQLSIEESIAIPTIYVDRWGDWNKEYETTLWNSYKKTIYDPCPVGYRVAVPDIWNGFTKDGNSVDRVPDISVSGEFIHGWNFIYDDSHTAWYPVTDGGNTGRYFSSSHGTSLYFYYSSKYECNVNPTSGIDYYSNYNVRCMKDDTHVDTSYPTVKINSIGNINSEGATIYADVTEEGISGVTERGIIWGTTENITLENASKVTANPGGGEYTVVLDGVSHSTKVYVRAYAINERGVSYSKVWSFYTPFEGDAVNLSRNGTANCYIVPVVYSDYMFDASVKGNSKESVGAIASVEVLWETRNTTYALEVTSVIESVELEGNNVKFRLPFDPKPGNALIAVKDANGTVLWSWHIWVVDYDPVATQQKYISGAIMMDRNLGALSVIPSPSTAENYEAYGLYYQWGRKDPFTRTYTALAPSNAITAVTQDVDSIEATIANPTVVYDDTNWGYDSTLWGVSKTKYDPCPYGWRVPDKNVWDGISNEYLQNASSTHRIIPEPYSTPQAYYPMAGCVDGYDGQWTNSFNDTGYWWTTSRAEKLQAHWCDHFYVSYDSVDYRMSVRCMKEAGNIKPGAGNDYIVDDEYEW